jgi:hypothetical protein
MFFRNLLRVTLAALFILVCFCVLFIGPMLNIAGVINFGWALVVLFISIILLFTTGITYGGKIGTLLSKIGVR